MSVPVEERMRIQVAATSAVTDILNEFEPHLLAAHEENAAQLTATILVRWNRGGCSREQVGLVCAASNDILAAVRVRRKELEDGTTSLHL